MNYTITVNELKTELDVLIRDIFVAQTEITENETYLSFPNGQKFKISIEECK